MGSKLRNGTVPVGRDANLKYRAVGSHSQLGAIKRFAGKWYKGTLINGFDHSGCFPSAPKAAWGTCTMLLDCPTGMGCAVTRFTNDRFSWLRKGRDLDHFDGGGVQQTGKCIAGDSIQLLHRCGRGGQRYVFPIDAPPYQGIAKGLFVEIPQTGLPLEKDPKLRDLRTLQHSA